MSVIGQSEQRIKENKKCWGISTSVRFVSNYQRFQGLQYALICYPSCLLKVENSKDLERKFHLFHYLNVGESRDGWRRESGMEHHVL